MEEVGGYKLNIILKYHHPLILCEAVVICQKMSSSAGRHVEHWHQQVWRGCRWETQSECSKQ